MHDEGLLGVRQDATEAARWYFRAADRGVATAQHTLGVAYAKGEGVPQNDVEAARWLRLAADQGHTQAQENLAVVEAAMTSEQVAEAQRLVRGEEPLEKPPYTETVYSPDDGLEKPQLLREVQPNYTARARRENIQGSVFMEMVVLPDGTVGDVRVTESLDARFGLDDEAVKAAKQWRFVPAKLSGKPVACLVPIEMFFKLHS